MQDTKRNYFYRETSNKTIIFLTIILTSLLVAGIVYYVSKEEVVIVENNIERKPIVKGLEVNPHYLKQEDLLFIQSTPLLEYIRQRLLYHSNIHPYNAIGYTQDEFEKDFPGEKGKVLVQLLYVFEDFQSKEEKIRKNKSMDEYQKSVAIEKNREAIWGKDLSNLLFPKTKYETIQKFFHYTDHYLKNHYDDDTPSKKIHIEKARVEIYGDDFEELLAKEPTSQQIDLELKIMEREMSIMSETEKEDLRTKIKSMFMKK